MPAKSVKKNISVFAAIHLGSEKISLKIVQYTNLNSLEVLDFAERKVRIGEETFKTGKISLAVVKEICELLNNYCRMMKEYGVQKHVVIGTTAMREARNRAFMIEQIFMTTGLRVEVIDMPLEIYYKYVAIARTLKAANTLNDGQATLFADISSGGLGITLVENEDIKYQQNIHIGVIRVKESFDKNQHASNYFNEALTEYISSIVSPVQDNFKDFNVKKIVLSGANSSLFLRMLNIKQGKNEVVTIPKSMFQSLYDRIINMKLAKVMYDYKLNEQEAEMILPTIIFYQQLISLSAASEIVFPPNSFIDAIILLHIAREKQHSWLKELDQQLIGFVYNIGKYYKFDLNHAKQVASFCDILFERTSKIHDLSSRDRLILQVAAILHDVGKCINLRQHYIYSSSLILSTDIFGFSDEEKKIIAYVAFHHAKGLFDIKSEIASSVTKEQIPVIAKLSVLLRIADALDRSYKQKITDCKISFKEDEMHIIVSSNENLSLERWTFEDKIDMFGEVFGIKPVLIEKTK